MQQRQKHLPSSAQLQTICCDVDLSTGSLACLLTCSRAIHCGVTVALWLLMTVVVSFDNKEWRQWLVVWMKSNCRSIHVRCLLLWSDTPPSTPSLRIVSIHSPLDSCRLACGNLKEGGGGLSMHVLYISLYHRAIKNSTAQVFQELVAMCSVHSSLDDTILLGP